MSAEVIGNYATAVFLLIGSGFVLVGVIGLLKFNDSMTRLHAPTKVGTVGIGMLAVWPRSCIPMCWAKPRCTNC